MPTYLYFGENEFFLSRTIKQLKTHNNLDAYKVLIRYLVKINVETFYRTSLQGFQITHISLPPDVYFGDV